MSGDPGLDKKITELAKLSIWRRSRLLVTKPCPTYLLTVKSADLRQKLADEELEEDLDTNFQAFREDVIQITQSMLHQPSGYGTPFATVPKIAANAKETTIASISQAIECEEAEMWRINEAMSMLKSGINELAQKAVAKWHSINYRYQNNSWGKPINSEADWNKHLRETNEKIAILEVGLLYHETIIQIFRDTIAEREVSKKEILARIERARKVVQDAEKLIPKIKDAERRCEASVFTNLKAAAKFVKGWQKLDASRAEFCALRGDGIGFQDFGAPPPIFPSTEGLIALEGDAERKGKIFGIFEKSQGGE